MVCMGVSRVNKQVFLWSDQMANRNCKKHNFVIREQFRQFELGRHVDINMPLPVHTLITEITENLMNVHVRDWYSKINREAGRSGNGRNKLRIYKLFKAEYKVEEYCKLFLPIGHRSAFAKFRCGVALIRIETGRFENLEVNQRLCPFCNSVEDDDLRAVLGAKAGSLSPIFNDLNDIEKMKFLFGHPSMIRLCAKTCFKILQKRNSLLYN